MGAVLAALSYDTLMSRGMIWRPIGSVLLYVDDVQRSYGRLGGLLRLACTHWRYDHWWSLERSSGGVCGACTRGLAV